MCTHGAAEECAGCDVSGSLMCCFETGDLAGFFLCFLPSGIAVVAGMILGGQWLPLAIALSAIASSALNLRRNACVRCINFSCPVNAVLKSLVDAYRRRNPVMQEAWEASGYRLGD